MKEIQKLEKNKDSTPPLECKLDDKIRYLMEMICDLKTMEREVQKMDYDTNRSPLGFLLLKFS